MKRVVGLGVLFVFLLGSYFVIHRGLRKAYLPKQLQNHQENLNMSDQELRKDLPPPRQPVPERTESSKKTAI